MFFYTNWRSRERSAAAPLTHGVQLPRPARAQPVQPIMPAAAHLAPPSTASDTRLRFSHSSPVGRRPRRAPYRRLHGRRPRAPVRATRGAAVRWPVRSDSRCEQVADGPICAGRASAHARVIRTAMATAAGRDACVHAKGIFRSAFGKIRNLKGISRTIFGRFHCVSGHKAGNARMASYDVASCHGLPHDFQHAFGDAFCAARPIATVYA